MSDARSARDRASEVVARLRDELVARYGWTWLDLRCRVDLEAGRIEVRGEVAVARTAVQVVDRLRREFGDGWAIDVDVTPLPGSSWHALTRPTELLCSRPGHDALRRLASEYLPADGPLQLLAVTEQGCLVRGRDGTIGWLAGEPGPVRSPPGADDPPPRIDLDALDEALRSWLRVPYRLGGTTREGLDCSALVQRCFAAAMAVRLPRHTGDQLALGGTTSDDAVAFEAGDLCFVWSREEAPGHVGVVTRAGTVVHASRSRGCVVADSLEGFLVGAARRLRVAGGDIFAYARAQHGRAILDLEGRRRASIDEVDPAATAASRRS